MGKDRKKITAVPALTAADDGACPGPDFILIGTMKCGTSTLSAYLEGHPNVFMVAGQDPDYFSRPGQWARGQDWYSGLFSGAGAAQICGEGSNSYTWDTLYPGTPERLTAACPGVKLIYMVRDPIARIVSHWVQVRADQGDAVPARLDDAIRAQPERLIAPSFYWRQLSHYRARVPDERIWIGFMEDLETNRAGVLRSLCAFLGIAPEGVETAIHRNPSQGKQILGPLYSRLRRQPGVRALSSHLPQGVRAWARRQLLSQVGTKTIQLDPELLAPVLEMLHDDSRALLAHCGKPSDYWTSVPRKAAGTTRRELQSSEYAALTGMD